MGVVRTNSLLTLSEISFPQTRLIGKLDFTYSDTRTTPKNTKHYLKHNSLNKETFILPKHELFFGKFRLIVILNTSKLSYDDDATLK